MLPGYMRLQDTMDRHQTEIADLQSRLQLAETSLEKKTRVLSKLIDNYYDVKDYIIGEEGKKVVEAAPAHVHDVQEDVKMMNAVDESDNEETMKEMVGAEGPKKEISDADNAREEVVDAEVAEREVDDADDAEEDGAEKKDAVNEEAREEVAEKNLIENEVTEDVVAENEVTANEGPLQPTSDMPPPSTPTVTLQPPTPQTSQEGETSVPTSLLQVPIANNEVADADNPLPAESKIPQSHSNSSSDVIAERRRSPRIRSRSPTPTPSLLPTKRKTEASGDEPVAKKAR
jgi:hypothetical protein